MFRAPITVRHYWQDYNDDDVVDGEICVDTSEEQVEFTTLSNLIAALNDILWVGEGLTPPETCNGGIYIYYHRLWPEGFHVGDPQYRSGSICFNRDVSPHLLRAVIARCDIYNANRR